MGTVEGSYLIEIGSLRQNEFVVIFKKKDTLALV